jgi:predicted phosphodiesterase
MRILHLTDTHLGSRWALSGAPPDLRADDHVRALELALAPAVREEVDVVVHSGDLFDRSHPDRPALAAARRLLGEAARRVPVLVMPGNHDRHGLAASVADLPGVHLADEPRRIEVGGVSFALVPFVRLAERFADALRRLGPADLVVAHQAFDGHRVPGFRFRVGAQPDTIGEPHLPEWVRHVMCGHLHPRQVVSVGAATVVCPGSTERTAFSEAEQTKGYALWQVGAEVRHRWRRTRISASSVRAWWCGAVSGSRPRSARGGPTAPSGGPSSRCSPGGDADPGRRCRKGDGGDMRTWALLAVLSTGCVVYADPNGGWSESSSTSTWSGGGGGGGGGREGQIEVSWQVGASGCEAAGVDQVQVDFDGDALGTFPCADGGAVVDAPVDEAKLEAFGIDGQGVTRYAGDAGRVRVRANEVATAPTIVLSALPASIKATWFFDNGHLCGANGIDTVEADLFDLDDTLQAQDELPCDQGQVRFDQVESGDYTVLLLARDRDGQGRYVGQAPITVLPGDALAVDVMLTAQ